MYYVQLSPLHLFWAHKSSLILQRFIEVSVQSQESERSCVFELSIFASVTHTEHCIEYTRSSYLTIS